MDLSLTQGYWPGSFQLRPAKVLYPRAGLLRRKRAKSAPAYDLDEGRGYGPGSSQIVHTREKTYRRNQDELGRGGFEDRAQLRARDCAMRQTSERHGSQSIH